MLLNTSKVLLVGSLVWVGVTPLAQSELKTFQPGEVIKSSEMNGNFEYLEGQIEVKSSDETHAQDSTEKRNTATPGNPVVHFYRLEN